MSADIERALDRLLKAAKVYSFNYMQDEAESEEDCVCGPKQHAEAVEVFAAIAEVEKARATPSPAPIQQPFAWIIVRDSTGEHDGGEPMTSKADADDYMENRCLPGWHLEALYRAAPTVKASQ